MDTPENLMMIVGIWTLKPRITVAALRQRCIERLLPYRRFRQRVEEDVMGAQWVEDEDFDIERHVEPAELQRRRGQSRADALREHVAALTSEPLDPATRCGSSTWSRTTKAAARWCRIHHCIADGIALISVMQSITDGGSDPPKRRTKAPAEHTTPTARLAGRRRAQAADRLTVKAIGMYGDGVAKSLDVLSHPQQPLPARWTWRAPATRCWATSAALALMPDDSPTLLKGKPGPQGVAWSEPLPLDEVKAVGKGLGCSVNDVLLSCVAGAIGSYLRDQGDDPAGKEIRAMVPVNLRPLEKGLASWATASAWRRWCCRSASTTRSSGLRRAPAHERLKGSYQPLLAFAVLSVSGLFIKPVQDAILGLFAKKATAVMTNVPGPAVPLKFCGARCGRTCSGCRPRATSAWACPSSATAAACSSA
jgi:diacylglycerol O-acyltransferase